MWNYNRSICVELNNGGANWLSGAIVISLKVQAMVMKGRSRRDDSEVEAKMKARRDLAISATYISNWKEKRQQRRNGGVEEEVLDLKRRRRSKDVEVDEPDLEWWERSDSVDEERTYLEQ
ncbi:hypothetical protein U1Q18_005674 [Sarracenia purpurea var. burkii]